MAKTKLGEPSANQSPEGESSSYTLADLRQDVNLWYKIHVLLYDLCHMSTDRGSEARTLCTTDELYISGPYFTGSEAEWVKAATSEDAEVPTEDGDKDPNVTADTVVTGESDAALPHHDAAADPSPTTRPGTATRTIEEAIKARLSGFLEKRKASGDSRPCGPHDLGPIYRAIFGISKADLQDEKFLARLRRCGLGDSDAEESRDRITSNKGGKGNKGEKRDLEG